MASVKVILRKEKQKKDGSYPLAIRIIKDRKVHYIHTDQSIDQKYWDESERRVKKSHPNSARLNNYLLTKLKDANDIALALETSNENTSGKEIKRKVGKKGKIVSFFLFGVQRVKNKHLSGVHSVARAERSILSNIEEFINHKKSASIEVVKEEIQQRRRKKIGASRKPGYSFLEELKIMGRNDSLYFEDINTSFLNQYKTFCLTYLGVKTRTVTNQLIFIRTLFNDAISQGIVDAKYYPFAGEKERIRIGSGMKIGLSREEVGRIESLGLEKGSQIWHARNVWLLAFYFAGIRITDVLSLRWGDFKDGRLYYTMHKNEKPVSLKIPEKAQAILDMYGSSQIKKKDCVFHYLESVRSNDSHDRYVKVRNATSLINKYLKKIAVECAIEKNLSNHIARHTFGNIAGDSIHPLMLQKLYRHSDLKTTINYQANFIHKEADEALDKVLNS